MKKQLLLILPIFIFFSSCYVNRSAVGDISTSRSGLTVYSQSRKVYLFAGLIGLSDPEPDVPKSGNYVIKTDFNVVDVIISVVTFSLITTRTIKIYALSK